MSLPDNSKYKNLQEIVTISLIEKWNSLFANEEKKLQLFYDDLCYGVQSKKCLGKGTTDETEINPYYYLEFGRVLSRGCLVVSDEERCCKTCLIIHYNNTEAVVTSIEERKLCHGKNILLFSLKDKNNYKLLLRFYR